MPHKVMNTVKPVLVAVKVIGKANAAMVSEQTISMRWLFCNRLANSIHNGMESNAPANMPAKMVVVPSADTCRI